MIVLLLLWILCIATIKELFLLWIWCTVNNYLLGIKCRWQRWIDIKVWLRKFWKIRVIIAFLTSPMMLDPSNQTWRNFSATSNKSMSPNRLAPSLSELVNPPSQQKQTVSQLRLFHLIGEIVEHSCLKKQQSLTLLPSAHLYLLLRNSAKIK